jgi:hypothetical protein
VSPVVEHLLGGVVVVVVVVVVVIILLLLLLLLLLLCGPACFYLTVSLFCNPWHLPLIYNLSPFKTKTKHTHSLTHLIKQVYSEFAGGGGAAKIDVNFVIDRLSSLSTTYGNLFQIPPYFAYIARAFGVLEGIGTRKCFACTFFLSLLLSDVRLLLLLFQSDNN